MVVDVANMFDIGAEVEEFARMARLLCRQLALHWVRYFVRGIGAQGVRKAVS